MELRDILRTTESEARELFEKLELIGEVKTEGLEDGSVAVRVTTEEPQVFIGERGQTLADIQHVLSSIVRKKIQQPLYIFLDINDYRKSREQYLKELARTSADEVALSKNPEELPPMSSAERRIVHMELASRADVVSESVGEGLDRRIVVKIKEQPT